MLFRSCFLDELNLITRLEHDNIMRDEELLSFWNRINDAKEIYRDKTYQGVSGKKMVYHTEQLAAILYRYAQAKGYDTTQGGMAVREFSDSASISDWAQEAMAWAVNAQVLSGKGNGVLDPQGTATRAEVAQMLMNFVEHVG